MRTKSVAKTFVYGVVLTTVIAFLGLYKTKILLQYLGEDNVGIYQLFYQIFLYLSLIDGGLTAGITYSLYKPVNDNNYNKVNGIIAGARSYFNKVGLIIIAIGIFLSFNIMFFIKSTELNSVYVQIAFIIFIIASSTSYFISSHAILYEAEQKLYKSSNINHVMTIIKTILEIILAMMGFKLVTLLLMFLLLTIIRNVTITIISRRDHKFLNYKTKKDYSFKKELNNLIVRKISFLIFDNTDILIISKFLGLMSVVIYTVYFQIINMITLIIKRLNSALLASVGNLLVSDRNKIGPVFNEINSMLFFIASVICVPIYFMLSPFIEIWFGERYTAPNHVLLLFSILLYVNIIKIVLEVFVDAAGKFKSVKVASIYQSILNVVLSLLLIKRFEIAGVLFATIIAFMIGTFIIYPKIIYHEILYTKVKKYYLKCFKLILGLIPNTLIIYMLFNGMINSNLLNWFFNGIAIFILNLILTIGYYYITKELLFFQRFKYIVKHNK